MEAAKATERLLELVEKRYPNWEGYRDPRFVEHEITYKQDAARKVQELLAEDTLRELARNEKYD